MSSTRRTQVIALAAIAACVVAVVGVVAVLRARDPARGPQVLVVGDSVTYMSADPVKGAFDWTDNVDVQGRPGYRTDQLVPVALRQIDQVDPDTLVILTGYNDLTQRVDTSEAVGQLMDISAQESCAVWVLLPTKGKFDTEAAQAFNDRIALLAEGHPNVHLAPGWRDAVDGGDGPEPDPELVSDDRIHPTEPGGTERLAEVVEEAAHSECG